jgi:hypothetical protein
VLCRNGSAAVPATRSGPALPQPGAVSPEEAETVHRHQPLNRRHSPGRPQARVKIHGEPRQEEKGSHILSPFFIFSHRPALIATSSLMEEVKNTLVWSRDTDPDPAFQVNPDLDTDPDFPGF